MFPTFISILDIQSWWEVPSIAHFCSLFRTAFNLLDFDIEDLEEALLTDGTEESSWLQELIVRLLSGCLPNNEISTFNYQMFLRRLFRQKCQEHDRYNPFNTDIDFQLLPLRTKVDILHALCDFRLDADDVLDQLKNLEADSLRVEPLGYDGNDSAYWYFYGTRLYREDFKTKNNKKKSVWQVICFTEDDWFQLTKKFKKSICKVERQLHQTLSENFLPELPRLFKEKESLARKRLLENQPRRSSSRLRKLELDTEKGLIERTEKNIFNDKLREGEKEEEESSKRQELEKRRQVYERQQKLRKQSEEENSSEDLSEGRDVMAAKKSKSRQRKVSASSTSSSKDNVASKTSKRTKKNETVDDLLKSSSSSKLTTVGRQTNNSLSAATGQILIQPVTNPNKKKVKTSQIFRQTDEDLQTGMHKILDFVKNHEDAWPFADPVEEEYAPNYYSIIRKPMDLQRMEERLESGYYKTFSKFKSDFQLIVDNCRLYNGAENEYTEMVDNLLKVFERATEKYLDQISSSDDEIAIDFSTVESEKTSKKKNEELPATSKRKPALAVQTDRRSDRSQSEESLSSKKSNSSASVTHKTKDKELEKSTKKQGKSGKIKKEKEIKKNKIEIKKDKSELKKEKDNKKTKGRKNKSKKSVKKDKKKPVTRSRSSSRSRSKSPPRSNLSSPPPSWPPSSPDSRFDFAPKKNPKKRQSHEMSDSEDSITKGKHKKPSKYKETFDGNDEFDLHMEKKMKGDSSVPSPVSSKPKDKHNKLRETIEKLKAKSEIKLKDEFDFELDHPKENKNKFKSEKEDRPKSKNKEKSIFKHKKDVDLDLDGNSTMDSIISESKKSKKPPLNKNNVPLTKSTSNLDALSIATEQTLKDINKWLDDTPKFSEFSSASNSPSYRGLDEFDSLAGSKIDQIPGKKLDKPLTKKEGTKEAKKRPFRDPSKFFKRREIQRTIDRLQPGKSKGNLISNVQSANKTDDVYPLGPLSKIKDTKNSLIVKTDNNAPKLSLGSVLDSFGKHKFVDDPKKEEEQTKTEASREQSPSSSFKPSTNLETTSLDIKEITTDIKEEQKEKDPTSIEDSSMGGATPNLSAWFKAFGAPKVPAPVKKNDLRPDGKENENTESRKVTLPLSSPNTDSPLMVHGQPVPRQRKISTGSSVSERSSFSQDMDSPRVGMDERGAYPAPYPSPLHRSPSGASPIMASPRPDISPKAAAYPTINGQIRVGFYQDTVSNKSSPDKSCSPRENPQSPYPHYSEHVYTPNTTSNSYYSYTNSPYYTHAPNYSSTNPTPPYNMESHSYYDTSKPLTDQYQTKSQNYTANSPASNHSSPAHLQHSQHSPNINSQPSPGIHSPHSPGIYAQSSPNILPQNSPVAQAQNSPSMHSQHSPNVQNSPSIHSQHSPAMHNPPSVQSIHSPNLHSDSPEVEPFQSQDEHKSADNMHLQQQSSQCTVFPVKKRVYNDDLPQIQTQRYEIDARLTQRNIQSNQVNLNLNPGSSPVSKGELESKDYENIEKSHIMQIESPSAPSPLQSLQIEPITSRTNMPTSNSPSYNSYSNGANYPLNVPSSRNITSVQQNKIDMSKYTNMGYTGPDVNYNRPLQQFTKSELTSTRTTVSSTSPQKQQSISTSSSQSGDISLRYGNPCSALQQMGYKSIDPTTNIQQAHTNFSSNTRTTEISERLPQVQDATGGYKSEVTIPRPTYNTSLDVDQPLSLGRNLSHIVDRLGKDERIIAGLQTSATYYNEKGLGTSHMFNKPISTNASGLPMFSQANIAAMQPYNQGVQGTTSSMYNRQITELQNPNLLQNETKSNIQVQPQEKKIKKRKNNKSATPANPSESQQSTTSNQGFQSYAGLKSNSSAIEPSAISLKTSSVVPGSAFNFGPTPTGLGIGANLYGDKDAYPNFLEEFRSAPNYYMAAAAAAHHRSTPEASEKQTRTAHQSSNPQVTTSYPFLGAPQARPTYPIGGPFIPNAQAQLMDTSSPLYQQYIQAGLLNQGLLGPPGAYPPGYHPALSMRQPYESMTRPSWL